MTVHRLEAVDLSATFGARTVFERLAVTAATGAVLGVTGPSGCGKTTLLRVLAGLHAPSTGEVRYDGSAVAPRGAIAMLAQHPRLVCNPRWTLRQIVAEPAAIRGDTVAVGEAAAEAGLDEALLERYPGQVSDGQLQRACIARMLVQGASFVLCDEPTAMLDPIATADVVVTLRELSARAAVVLVSHDEDLVAELADDVVALSVAA